MIEENIAVSTLENLIFAKKDSDQIFGIRHASHVVTTEQGTEASLVLLTLN